ncbi:MAG: L-serine ammonia-lyase [Oligosphaeraceae bacterium]|nr:L-serine ammonia-lyase [Oligosphaeraceae bacterium]
MDVITTSIFDIFKPGPGPSSSHTIGPMRAAERFLQTAAQLPAQQRERIESLRVHLFGSLSSTGRGHGTDRAVLAGLLGQRPEDCQPQWFCQLLQDPGQSYSISIQGKTIPFQAENFRFEKDNAALAHANTLRFDLLGQDELPILSRTYYSIGGGFILCAGEIEPARPQPLYPYTNFQQFLQLVSSSGLTAPEILLRNEESLSGSTRQDILQRLDKLLALMEQAVARGLQANGVLPGKIGLERKAAGLFSQAASKTDPLESSLLRISAFAMAAAEENADGQLVVTAPTSGASGVLPGIIYLLRHYQGFTRESLRDGLLIAGLIAFVAKHNASISGAEVGCQGEVGVAAAMAAAFLAQSKGYPLNICENAAESALEHHLGLTCDPIGGYVQIPCIERNAVGAVSAYNAYLLAAGGNPNQHKLRFDDVVLAMLETGRGMSSRYKETACGGLAIRGMPGRNCSPDE